MDVRCNALLGSALAAPCRCWTLRCYLVAITLLTLRRDHSAAIPFFARRARGSRVQSLWHGALGASAPSGSDRRAERLRWRNLCFSGPVIRALPNPCVQRRPSSLSVAKG